LALIIDTNALSAIVDGDPAIKPILQRAPSVEISVITLGEYWFGILQSSRKSAAERWLRDYLRFYRMLDISQETSKRYAELRVALKRAGTPIPSNDLWIAAQSREHDLPVLSRDRHFDHISALQRLNW
jgi:tRNA(fMet)-specific endonuclease VapC